MNIKLKREVTFLLELYPHINPEAGNSWRLLHDNLQNILEELSNDSYYDAIPLSFWVSKSHEAIAEELNCSVSTVVRNKHRLMNSVALALFGEKIF